MTCPACASSAISAAFEKNGYRIDRCATCGTHFVQPTPSQDDLNAFYQAYYQTSKYSAKINSKIRRAGHRLRSVGPAAGRSLLDVGCNVGFSTEAARRAGFTAYGVDVDHDAISRAQDMFPEARFSVSAIEEIVERGELYDVIYCSEVIEHVRDPEAFARCLAAALRPGGALVLTTPDIGGIAFRLSPDRLRAWDGVRPPEHLTYFTRKGMRALLERTGFQAVRFTFSLKPSLRLTARRT